MTVDYLKQCFTYKDGELVWNKRPATHFSSQGRANIWNAKYAGKVAGATHKTGYVHIKVDGKVMKAHRIVWALHNDAMPDKTIDHINGVKADNRIENLRHVTQKENCQNMKARNGSIISGVYLRNQRGFDYWYASISVDSVKKHLIATADLFEAICARKSAEIKYGYLGV